jgi:hypothetical protein
MLTTYVDANWARDWDTKQSTIGTLWFNLEIMQWIIKSSSTHCSLINHWGWIQNNGKGSKGHCMDEKVVERTIMKDETLTKLLCDNQIK